MSKHCNPICATCPRAYEQLNGRYCTVLKKIVEHATAPLCETDKK